MLIYKFDAHQFPTISALLSGKSTSTWSSFFLLAFLPAGIFVSGKGMFSYFDMTQHEIEPFSRTQSEIIKNQTLRVNGQIMIHY